MVSVFFDLLLGDVRGGVVGYGSGENGDVLFRDLGLDGLIHVGCGDDGEKVDAFWEIERSGAGDEEDLVTTLGGGGGKGVAHLTGRAIREVAHGIDRLLGGACGDEDLHALCFATAVRMSSTSARRPVPLYPQARSPSAGSMNWTPSSLSCARFR